MIWKVVRPVIESQASIDAICGKSTHRDRTFVRIYYKDSLRHEPCHYRHIDSVVIELREAGKGRVLIINTQTEQPGHRGYLATVLTKIKDWKKDTTAIRVQRIFLYDS